VKLREIRLLTDENLDPDVIVFLRQAGFDVLDVCEKGLQGSTDLVLLRLAFAENRVIVTHDSDFGTLAILNHEPVVGVIFIRPGHIDPQFTVDTLKVLLAGNPEVFPPFIVVAKRTKDHVAVRIRRLAP
jgi:predicted nuclease of predicted toxin-antitoxin system